MGRTRDRLQALGVNLSELSAEQLAEYDREDAEQERRDAQLAQVLTNGRRAEADTYVQKLKDASLDDPGLLAYVHGVLMSDDGGPVIELSLDAGDGRRTQPENKTASELLRGFIDRLPKDDKGKVTLAQQARQLPGDHEDPPPAETDLKSYASSAAEARKRADDLAAELAEQDLGSDLHFATSGSN